MTDDTQPVAPLAAERLYREADLSELDFSTTADLDPAQGLVGQERALDAIRFGTQVDRDGFNLFVIGPHGAQMQEAVKGLLAEEKREEPQAAPSDWVYVNNFEDSEKPVAIELPSGRSRAFQQAMDKLVEDLKSALPAVFQSEEYQTRKGAIDEEFQKKQSDAFSELREKASEKNIVILRTPMGFSLAPSQDGKVVPPEEFNNWPEERREEVKQTIESLEKELEHIVNQIPQWEKERREKLRKLNRETASYAVHQLIEETKETFRDLPKVLEHIDAVRDHIVENVETFVQNTEGEKQGQMPETRAGSPFDQYKVNVLVSQSDTESEVPVVQEFHPTLSNLIGRIEHLPVQGALITNFLLIKPGAMHRANGGYLLLDVRQLLTEPFSWAALKRTLQRGEIAIEDVARFMGLTSTVSLEPDPIPMNLKVILFGDRLLYFLLSMVDPEVQQHFKVLADFENDFRRNPENEAVLARLVAAIAERKDLRALERDAVARVLEHAARLAEHSEKLSLLTERLQDVLIESDFRARQAGREKIARADVQQALDARIHRAARIRDRMQESILEDVALIDTDGAKPGQINGLSVMQLGGFSFGRPTRITCQVRPGTGKVVDIEREVELGGPVHSKGVMILSGYLAGRYALDTPMSLFASLVFEQSYGGVEGDSASSAELYTLLSSLADMPLRQDMGVTGSVNQRGEVQAIGGVNDKIEGFFDICKARGLTGQQGVLIPQANVQHLMLRQDVIEACRNGAFAIYPIRHVDEGISLLTGLSAGERGDDGRFPEDSLNRRVEDKLRQFATIRREFARQKTGEGSE